MSNAQRKDCFTDVENRVALMSDKLPSTCMEKIITLGR